MGTSVLQRHIREKDGGLDGTIFRVPSNPDIVWQARREYEKVSIIFPDCDVGDIRQSRSVITVDHWKCSWW